MVSEDVATIVILVLFGLVLLDIWAEKRRK